MKKEPSFSENLSKIKSNSSIKLNARDRAERWQVCENSINNKRKEHLNFFLSFCRLNLWYCG
jgi:hypothetical protein